MSISLGSSGTASATDFDITLEKREEDGGNNSGPSIAAHYTFDGNANDISGNGNNGVTNGTSLVTDRFGQENSALYFNGLNDVVRIPFEGTLRIDKDITINTWINVTQSQDVFGEVLQVKGSPNQHYEMYVGTGNWNGGDRFRAGFKAGGFGDESSIDCPGNDCENRPYVNRWYMVTYTFGKETFTDEFTGEVQEIYNTKTYLDGQLVTQYFPNNNWNNSLPSNARCSFNLNIYIRIR